MKTNTRRGQRRLQLRIQCFGNDYYLDRIARLETALKTKPRTLRIDMVGMGGIPADTALLIRSILLERSPGTRIITRSRSSLYGSSVLVWLMGDSRIIRNDATLFFRPANLPDDRVADPKKAGRQWEPKYRDSYDEFDPRQADYARVLELINEFLPVKELAGRVFGMPILQQFGLVESEGVDCFLTKAFSKSDESAKPLNGPEQNGAQPSGQPENNQQN